MTRGVELRVNGSQTDRSVSRPGRSTHARSFVVDVSGTCRVETEVGEKRRALIVWCDDLIAHLRGKSGSQLADLRRSTQALRDRLRDVPLPEDDKGSERG